MSKAFTKETEGADDDLDLEESEQDQLPKNTKNYMTPVGAQKLKDELKELLYVKRPELVKTVSWAASNGDRSENADYQYGKRRLREFDRRIRFLTKRLEAAEIVDPLAQPKDRILFGAKVTLRNENGDEKIYRIVGIDEADASKGEISWISPLAKAILGAKIGDLVNFKSPKGEEELEIIEIHY